MSKYYSILLLLFTLLFGAPSLIYAQECFFVKNVLDTLYKINPTSGNLASVAITPDFPNQNFYGYLSTIDPIGRRYMYVTRLSDTSFDDFGLKIIQVDNLTINSVLLTGYESASPGVGQFSFHGLEYGAIANEVYMARVAGDSLYKIDINTGAVSAVKSVPNFDNTYAYLHTFYQSEQRYAMIATDASYQKRFIQIDIDDDTVYVSPPMNFPEPIRALEVSEQTGEYFVISDVDQTFYKIDPINGVLTALFPVPGYQSAFGYLHSFDFTTDQYLMVGLDTNQSISLFSIQPSTGNVTQVPFPVPVAGYFGLEATNTQFIARMLEELEEPEPDPTSVADLHSQPLPFKAYPNPARNQITIDWDDREAVQIDVFDMKGNKRLTHASVQRSPFMLNLSSLDRGAYFLRVRSLSQYQIGQQLIFVK